MTEQPGHGQPLPTEDSDETVPTDDVEQRADLLPEEEATGPSADPRAQAEVILEESAERTEHPDPEASTQTARRSAEDAAR
jgi:hypothetical protein